MQQRSLLIITGSMGAGKTSVLGEASDILALQNLTHAAIDLDAFGLAHLQSGVSSDTVMYRNLRSVCKNYASLGVRRFLLARAGMPVTGAGRASIRGRGAGWSTGWCVGGECARC